MLCLPPATLNPGATLAPSPQPRRTRPSRAAGSCLHHPQTFETLPCRLNEGLLFALGARKRTGGFPPEKTRLGC
jgi:hypothetical protein